MAIVTVETEIVTVDLTVIVKIAIVTDTQDAAETVMSAVVQVDHHRRIPRHQSVVMAIVDPIVIRQFDELEPDHVIVRQRSVISHAVGVERVNIDVVRQMVSLMRLRRVQTAMESQLVSDLIVVN